MCGSATLTMVVSSTWISVADITASVTSRRSLIRPSFILYRDEDAAPDALEQRLLLRFAPPARQAPARLVSQDDQVGADAAGERRDALDGVAEFERAFRPHA